MDALYTLHTDHARFALLVQFTWWRVQQRGDFIDFEDCELLTEIMEKCPSKGIPDLWGTRETEIRVAYCDG